MSKIFKHKDFELTIFVEDTDFQGFVYHANYIKYFERARSNFLTINGISQNDLRQSNLGFVIKRIDIDFFLAAKSPFLPKVTNFSTKGLNSFAFGKVVVICSCLINEFDKFIRRAFL